MIFRSSAEILGLGYGARWHIASKVGAAVPYTPNVSDAPRISGLEDRVLSLPRDQNTGRMPQ